MKYSDDRLIDYRTDATIERGGLDLPFATLTILLLSIGVIMVLSASYVRAYYTEHGNATYYFTRQLVFAVSGVAIMFIASKFPIQFYRKLSYVLLAVTAALLLVVLVVGIGPSAGVKRWIQLPGGQTIQPSEFAKIAVILVFADMICKYKTIWARSGTEFCPSPLF